MTNFEEPTPQGSFVRTDITFQVVFVLAAVCAIFLAFALANSTVAIETKTRGFSSIIAGFLLACVCLHFWQKRRASAIVERAILPSTTRGLDALEEANEFFSGSIKAADMLRLVSSRVRAVKPFRTSALFLPDKTGTDLRVAAADGPDSERIRDLIHKVGDAPVGICFSKGSVQTAHRVPGSGGLTSIAAIPLMNGSEAFGVLCLYFDQDSALQESDTLLFEAIGVRLAPLVLSSIALEKTLSNAMTDGTTDLPNERAFYVVLENQISETQRDRDSRPLTVLAADIRNFDDINQRFGHVAGDRVLSMASRIIKENLRQMDLLARCSADEFLIVLPTASKEISHEIIARIISGFFGRKLKVAEGQSVEIELNFGWAAFGTDGESANGLIATARSRKDQAKSTEPNKVLWFPQEFVN